ncbi:MAG: EAL domain-containing protein [Parvibaculum sp.]
MSRLNNVLMVTASSLIAGLSAFAIIMFGGLQGLEAGMAAGLVLLGTAQLYGRISRSAERRSFAKSMADLNSFTTGIHRDLERAEAALEKLTERFETETTERNAEIVAEMRLIETLVKRLAEDRIAEKKKAEMIASDTALPSGVVAFNQGEAGEAMPANVAAMSDVELLDTIRDALEDNRVDLYLQPIVTLPQRKVRYYEALTRLRGDHGEVIMPRDYMRVAEPAGIMPTIDNLLLFRCVQIVRKLNERDADTGVFCNISANSLLDSDFFPQFIEYMEHNKHLAEQLVFEFSQATISGIGPIEQASLMALSRLGFRFSMDQVTDINFDYRKLYELNIRYVKISVNVLVAQADDGRSDIRPEDIKELMSRFGINLIVDMIEKERSVVDVLDFNVDYGQGYLFGTPRPVRDDVLGKAA